MNYNLLMQVCSLFPEMVLRAQLLHSLFTPIRQEQTRAVTVAKKKRSKDKVVKLSKRFVKGLQNPHAGPDAFFSEGDPFRFAIRSTKSGSMTQEIFYGWCIHFVKHLPKNQ